MKNLMPKETWALLQQQPEALFIDVRMEIEARYVGYPPALSTSRGTNFQP